MPLPIVTITRGSLTDGHEAVLVNASNTNCALGTGVSGAISRSCGPRFQEQVNLELQRKFGGPMKPGQVLMTHAGKHPRARWVAHVAVMDYRQGFSGASFPTKDTIRTGCESLWDAIETIPGDGKLSVAMVALGGGTGSLGVREPARVAAETLKAHAAIHRLTRIEKVVFYGYLEQEYVAMAEVLFEMFPSIADSLPKDVLELIKRLKG
jgi:O-acetyl-ADP-ribose deacetylase (regulator of RNase III)